MHRTHHTARVWYEFIASLLYETSMLVIGSSDHEDASKVFPATSNGCGQIIHTLCTCFNMNNFIESNQTYNN